MDSQTTFSEFNSLISESANTDQGYTLNYIYADRLIIEPYQLTHSLPLLIKAKHLTQYGTLNRYPDKSMPKNKKKGF